MVWGAICKKCKLPLSFINIGVARNLYEEDYFCYQQNSAPSRVGNHKRAEFFDSSRLANPFDYFACEYILDKIENTKHMI
jgi:hypothetical protein